MIFGWLYFPLQQTKLAKKNMMNLRFFTSLIGSFLITIITAMVVEPSVKGECANCHTMHNSQDGALFEVRSDSAFSPDDAGNYEVNNLLINTCIGCHSSTGSQTIVTLGNTRFPIVFNLAEPTNSLAGGNFYWVSTRGDEYGHNVLNRDAILDKAPGGETAFGPTPNSCGFQGCHSSLAEIRYAPGGGALHNPIRGNGCIGCHDPAHHTDDEKYMLAGSSKYVDESGGGYRFLNKAGKRFWDIPPHNPPAVAGIEHPDWGQNATSISHNEYQDSDKPWAPGAYGAGPNPTSSADGQGISDFCAGCHNTYHSWPLGGSPNGDGATNPWLRHPSGVVIPNSGEYTAYSVYDPNVPVARNGIATLQAMGGPSSIVSPGTDKVMCLSCHTAHASQYPDMLRWDYSAMISGDGGDASDTGCFKCHSQKD